MAVSSKKLLRAIPSLGAAIFTIFAPLVSWQSLWMLYSAEPRIKPALDDPIARALMDVYLQFASIFVGLTVLSITAFVYVSLARTVIRKFIYGVSGVFGTGIFIYIFLLGGASNVPFDLYLHGGPFQMKSPIEMIPSFDSWLTWVRGAVILLGFLLAFFAPAEK